MSCERLSVSLTGFYKRSSTASRRLVCLLRGFYAGFVTELTDIVILISMQLFPTQIVLSLHITLISYHL